MVKKTVKFIIVLICMLSIFLFSSDNGDESTRKSDGIIINMCNIFMKNKINSENKTKFINRYVFFVRKTAHFTIFLLLGVSLISLVKEYMIINYKTLLFALFIAIIYACSDEVHQLFVIGRSARILDVFIDSFGSLFGITIYYLFYVWRNKNEQKKAIS